MQGITHSTPVGGTPNIYVSNYNTKHLSFKRLNIFICMCVCVCAFLDGMQTIYS